MEQKSIWWRQCLCVWTYGYIWLTLLHLFFTCAYVCVFWGVWGVLRRIFESSSIGLRESNEKPATPTLVPIRSHTHTHINISPANLSFFCAVFHHSATAVPGDTDRERNFRPHGNLVYVCVYDSGDWFQIELGCHSRCLCPEQLTTKYFKGRMKFDVTDSQTDSVHSPLLTASVSFLPPQDPLNKVE